MKDADKTDLVPDQRITTGVVTITTDDPVFLDRFLRFFLSEDVSKTDQDPEQVVVIHQGTVEGGVNGHRRYRLDLSLEQRSIPV